MVRVYTSDHPESIVNFNSEKFKQNTPVTNFASCIPFSKDESNRHVSKPTEKFQIYLHLNFRDNFVLSSDSLTCTYTTDNPDKMYKSM